MRRPNRTIDIFNISMLDTISGALGAFLLIMLVLMRSHEPEVVQRNAELEAKLKAAAEQAAQTQKAIEELQRRAQTAEASLAQAAERAKDLEQRLGVSLSEREVVFVVDVSGSMAPENNEDKEDRLREVVSGIKMLVATMTDDYSIDVVFFPDEQQQRRGPYGAMWGQLQAISDQRKYEIYRYLQGLRAFGGTPTGEAMEFVLGPAYQQAKTVVLLSDGVPNRLIGNKSYNLDRNELQVLVEQLTRTNGGRKTINTIGVGSPFRRQNNDDNAVFFLRTLAQQNDGFYIGF